MSRSVARIADRHAKTLLRQVVSFLKPPALNAADLQDRLRNAFPNLLEIRREGLRKADYTAVDIPEEEPDPYELCCGFLGDTDEAERELLKSVINSVRVVWK